MPKRQLVFLSGLGADSRLFSNFNLKGDYDIRHIDFELPQDESMANYARQLSRQLDEHPNRIVIGVSIGGMISTEMHELINPLKTIIISSAKCKYELPKKYRVLKHLPIHQLIPASWMKMSAQVAQPLIEPDQNREKETFNDMLSDKDPALIKGLVELIVNWDRVTVPEGIIHIHGDEDNTIPLSGVSCNYLLKGGSHMMALTDGETVGKMIEELIEKIQTA